MIKDQKIISIKELAVILGKTESSIRYHIRMGRIKPTVRFGRSYGFDPEQVVKDLQKGLIRY